MSRHTPTRPAMHDRPWLRVGNTGGQFPHTASKAPTRLLGALFPLYRPPAIRAPPAWPLVQIRHRAYTGARAARSCEPSPLHNPSPSHVTPCRPQRLWRALSSRQPPPILATARDCALGSRPRPLGQSTASALSPPAVQKRLAHPPGLRLPQFLIEPFCGPLNSRRLCSRARARCRPPDPRAARGDGAHGGGGRAGGGVGRNSCEADSRGIACTGRQTPAIGHQAGSRQV